MRLISFEKDVQPLFMPNQIECMKSTQSSFNLLVYSDVRGRADLIYALLIGGGDFRMPLGGPYWSKDNQLLFKRWMEARCPE